MARFLRFLTSLGIGFFYRCVNMSQKERIRTLSSLYLYLGRVRNARVPAFFEGERACLEQRETKQQKGETVLWMPDYPFLDPNRWRDSFVMTQAYFITKNLVLDYLPPTPPTWAPLGMVFLRERWQRVLREFSFPALGREEMPFSVGDGVWERMQRPKHAPRRGGPRPATALELEHQVDDWLRPNPVSPMQIWIQDTANDDSAALAWGDGLRFVKSQSASGAPSKDVD
ncbi:hypothetical protein ACHAQA_005181 [Verticillium albo-atrum]